MSLETVLKCTIVGSETDLPPMNPTSMTYWRKGDKPRSYLDYAVRMAGINDADHEEHPVSEVLPGDFVQIKKFLFPAEIFMQKLKDAGFMKLCGLGRPVGTQFF